MSGNDLLPTTHAISAMGKNLKHEAGLGEMVYELAAITVLKVILFLLGNWVFSRRHIRAGG
ncbi:MAG: hypothetical protein GTO18_17850 [Anaerolineales bacterium]|nr:hypothetical protein [Anaerolineales bacterium]